MRAVLFAGLAGHGKDTAASIFKHEMEKAGKKCFTIHHGDFLKFICSEYFRWDGSKDVVGRNVLQRVGDGTRGTNNNVWVDAAIAIAQMIDSKADYVLVPDFRYPNERTRWMEAGFKPFTVWIFRKDYDNGLTEEQKANPSETSLLTFPFDHVIAVPSKMERLGDEIRKMIKRFKL